jgi:GNAT superfamily N-acetyltransferase
VRAGTEKTKSDLAAAEARSRAIAWRHGAHAAVCDQVAAWTHGTVVAATRLPRYWDYNTLRLEGPAPPGVTAQALAEEADALQDGLAHRRIECEHEASGARLMEGFEALGWRVSRLAWMHYDGTTDAQASPGVVETDFERIRPLRAEWLGAEDTGSGPPGVDAFLADEQHVALLLPGRATSFTVFDAAGDPAAYCTLRIAGARGDIEDVYCTPAQRGRGLATALVASAVARARDSGVIDLFIAADEDDWPKDLYARLGFRTVWLRHDAVLRPE